MQTWFVMHDVHVAFVPWFLTCVDRSEVIKETVLLRYLIATQVARGFAGLEMLYFADHIASY